MFRRTIASKPGVSALERTPRHADKHPRPKGTKSREATNSRGARRRVAALTAVLLAVIAPGAAPPNSGAPTPPPELDWPTGTSILPSEPVGYIAATSSVSPTGEYRISVPLDVPPGRAGMAPTISLQYGSNSGNGIAGVGWSLSATSLIQRCQSTLATEGVADGVDFDHDSLCLDGAKLIVVPGADGEVGTQYRTEQDPFAKIVALGDDGSGPMSFTVHQPDGRMSTYAPVEGLQGEDPVRFAYMLTETFDRSGNSIRYDYNVDPGDEEHRGIEVTLWRILYTNKDFVDGKREVIFDYDPRPDPMFAYASAVRTRQDVRLASIHMRAPNPESTETIWSYALEYALPEESPSGRSLLARVRKVDAQGESLWAKEFDWALHQRPQFEFHSFANELSEDATTESSFPEPAVLPVDVDGDGRDELLYAVGNINGLGQYNPAYLRKTSSPTSSLPTEKFEVPLLLPYGRPLDREKDGIVEIAARGSTTMGSPYDIFKWNPASSSFEVEAELGTPGAPVVGDFNGDGWNDIMAAPSHEVSVDVSWYVQFGHEDGFGFKHDLDILHKHKFKLARALDLHGDGRDDVIIDDPAFISNFAPPDFVPSRTLAISVRDDGDAVTDTYRFQLGDQRNIVLADINGDGLKDAVDTSSLHLIKIPVRYNTGTRFEEATLLPTPISKAPDDKFAVRVADFDRDGTDDLLVLRTQHLPLAAVYLSRGSDFQEVPISFTPQPAPFSESWEAVKIGDFNGDGLPDIVQLRQTEHAEGSWTETHWNAHIELFMQESADSDVIVGYRDELAEKARETVTYTRRAASLCRLDVRAPAEVPPSRHAPRRRGPPIFAGSAARPAAAAVPLRRRTLRSAWTGLPGLL